MATMPDNVETPPTSSFEVLEKADQIQRHNMNSSFNEMTKVDLLKAHKRILNMNQRYQTSLKTLNKQLDEAFKCIKSLKSAKESCEEREMEYCQETKVTLQKKDCEIEKLKDTIRELKIKNKTSEQRAITLEEQTTLLMDQLKETRLEEACSEDIATHSLNKELLTVKHTNNAIERQLEEERYAKAKLENYNQEIIEKNDNLKQQVERLRKELDLKLKENEQLLFDVNTVNQEYRNLRIVVKRFEEERKNIQDHLKEQKEKYRNSHQFHNTEKVEASDTDMLKNALLAERLKSGTLFERLQSMEREVEKLTSASSCLQEIKQDNSDLIIDIEKLKNQVEKQTNEIENLQKELNESKQKERAANEEVRTVQQLRKQEYVPIPSIEYEEKIKALEVNERRVEHENFILNKKYLELKDDIDERMIEIKQLKEEKDSQTSKYIAMKEMARECKKTNEQLTKELNSLRYSTSEIEAHKIQLDLYKNDYEQQKRLSSELREEKDRFEKHYVDTKAKLDKLLDRIKQQTDSSGDINSVVRHHGSSIRVPMQEAPILPPRPRSTEQIYKCPICSLAFETMRALELHADNCMDYLPSDSIAQEQKFCCPVCQSNQENLDKLQAHVVNCGDFSNI
ncbi:DgyrCDS456 [Dimorphilus gyrociliatus]|uniref:DgyrCDS456 n=1 Tax=Dimorphilus gyrociliatus TaxID=2664684 RepID=A0A7I8V4I2_9ANNE|nr:DgyrCDS456 [Dimorphilus gyrociliatus]